MEAFRLFQTGFSTLFLPGLLFLAAGRGLRGMKFREIAVYSFITSIVTHGIFLFILGVWLKKVNWTGVLLGYVKMAREGLDIVLSEPYGPDALASLIAVSVASWAAGHLNRWLSTWRGGKFFKKPFSIEPRSALDVELMRLRDEKLCPAVTVRLVSGDEIR
ncbi:MAG: hypothetical protein ACPLRU_08885, partial [Desulfofundulus sp.]